MIRGVVFALCIALALGQSSRTCVFNAGTFTTYDQVYQCYYSIPIDLDVKAQTLQSLRNALQLYTFVDISIESPSPELPVHIDILAALDEIEARPYKYDYEFHADLRAIFLYLYDAHTQYYPPTCYLQMNVRQPFAPISYVDDSGEQVVAIGPWWYADLDAFYQGLGVNVRDYQGAIINKVDGIDAMEYFYTYANESIGMSKDPGTRFNMAMTRPEPRPDMVNVQASYWTARSSRNPTPKAAVVDYELTLQNGTQVSLSLPWSFLPTKSYTGVSNFMNDYWASSAKDDTTAELQRPGTPPVVEDMSSRNIEVSDMESFIGGEADDSDFINLVNGTQLSFWMLNDSKTVVMYLDTFGPSSLIDTYKILNEGFEAAAKNGLSRLVIDLTNNGGGSICLGRSLIAYLQKNGTNYGPEDLACSPLQQQLTENAATMNVESTVWSPGFYANFTDDNIPNDDTSYLIPGVPHVRGGKLRNYTRLVHIKDCGDFGYRISPAVDFAPDDIIILTHGFCGSTCSLFSTHLALYDNVRTLVYGGIDGQPQQFFSFPGGQVLDTPGLWGTIAQLGFDTSAAPVKPDELQPRALPTTAAYRFCVREVYPNEKAYSAPPMEFSFQPGTYRQSYDLQTAVAPEYGWYYAASLFDQ